jgi:hypothetical protein
MHSWGPKAIPYDIVIPLVVLKSFPFLLSFVCFHSDPLRPGSMLHLVVLLVLFPPQIPFSISIPMLRGMLAKLWSNKKLFLLLPYWSLKWCQSVFHSGQSVLASLHLAPFRGGTLGTSIVYLACYYLFPFCKISWSPCQPVPEPSMPAICWEPWSSWSTQGFCSP